MMFINMDTNFDLGIIKIPLSVFKEIYENHTDFINEGLERKAKDLVSNYNCFISNYDAKSLWEKKKIIASQKKHNRYNPNHNSTNHRSRPFVLLIDLNDDVKFKKEFTSYLNKLTDINKDIIYNKISIFMKSFDEIKLNSLFEILINFIKVASNTIYIDILYLFPESFIYNQIKNYCNSYLSNEDWIPNKEFIINNKIIYNNDNYDNYCKFVKNKKQTIAILKALLIINRKLKNEDFLISIQNNLSNSIDTYIQNNEYKHITEFLLDQLLITFEYITDNKVINKIKNLNVESLDYSTKFKILKITEKY